MPDLITNDEFFQPSRDEEYDIWVDFNEINDDNELVTLLAFANTKIKVGQTVSIGDELEIKGYGDVLKISDTGLVTIKYIAKC